MERTATADPEALALHADEVVAGARGRTLVLWEPGNAHPPLPPTVSDVVHWGDRPARGDLGGDIQEGRFDSIVSLGQLGAVDDLPARLAALLELLAPGGVLLFCEPTVCRDDTAGPPHDVTGCLWAGGWSVIECRRFGRGRRGRGGEWCWGRARRTGFVGPRRRLA